MNTITEPIPSPVRVAPAPASPAPSAPVPSDPPHSAELARLVREDAAQAEAEVRRAAEKAAEQLRIYGLD